MNFIPPRQIFFIVVCCVLWNAAAAIAQEHAARHFERGVVVRNVDDILFNVDSARTIFFDFCRNPHGADDPATVGLLNNPVDHIAIAAKSFLDASSNNCSMLRKFISEAHEKNIAVEFIDGDGAWITNNVGQGAAAMAAVQAFNREGNSSEKFDAFLFDVRPEGWALTYTAATRPNVANLLRAMAATGNRAGERLPLEIILPRWFYPRLGRDALADVMRLVNMVVIDDYVHQESVLIESMDHETALADSLGVTILAGINAQDNMNPSLTYAEVGWLPMERAITNLCAAYASRKNFAGCIINDYQSYKNLPRSRHHLPAQTISFQEKRLPAICAKDSSEVIALDEIAASAKPPVRADMDNFRQHGSTERKVLMSVSLTTLLPFVASTKMFKIFSHAEYLKLFSRVMDAGCDGILIDVASADSLTALSGKENIHSEIIDALDSLGYAFRDMHSKPAMVIVLRGSTQMLPNFSEENFARLCAIVDGTIAEVPGPMFMRDRDSVLARLSAVSNH